MKTIGDLLEVEKRFIRIEAVLDKMSPGWRESKSDPGQLADLRSLVSTLGPRFMADERAKYPGVSDSDWQEALLG